MTHFFHRLLLVCPSRGGRFRACLLLSFACTGLSLRAETLEQLTAEALRRNPELRVIEASTASAQGGVVTARAWQNPELSIAPGFKRTTDGGASETSFHGTFELSQLFEFPGKRQLRIAIAERNVEVSRLALEGLRFQLATAVRKAFYEQLAAQRIVTLRREQIASAQVFYETALKRAQSGYASEFEGIRGQADLINAKKAERAALGQIAEARIGLNILAGRSASAPLEVTGELGAAMPRSTTADFIGLAMARNPSLRTQLLQAEVAGLNLRKTRFGKRPDFAIGPQVEYTPGEQIYGLGVTIALPVWNQGKGEIQTATAEQRRVLAEIDKLRLEIAGAVTRVAARVDVARDQLALYSPEFLEKLKGFVAQAEKSYAQSATTLLIYLDAKRTYFDTLADYYQALGNVPATRAELESALGVPLDINRSKPAAKPTFKK